MYRYPTVTAKRTRESLATDPTSGALPKKDSQEVSVTLLAVDTHGRPEWVCGFMDPRSPRRRSICSRAGGSAAAPQVAKTDQPRTQQKKG
jgi:hypothetical protein